MDWYVSSSSYAAVPVWAASTAYTVGQFVRAVTLPAISAQYVFRCTTAGTSSGTEPTWSIASTNNATRTDGTVTWTNVSGQSAYGWSAAAGAYQTICGSRPVVGDRVFLSSDHSETATSAGVIYNCNGNSAAFGLIQIVSVNRAGSVPPVAADMLSGAVITYAHPGGTAHFILDGYCDLFWQGITFTLSGSSGNASLYFNNASTANKSHYLKNCSIVIASTLASTRITTNSIARVTLDSTTVQFGATGQSIGAVVTGPFEFHWINTSSAIVGAILPTALFITTNDPPLLATVRGVDLSAITGTLVSHSGNGGYNKVLFDSCKIASSVTRFFSSTTAQPVFDEAELVNCHDGTNVINEKYSTPGAVSTDRTTYMTSGATDDIGAHSLKLVSNARSDKSTLTLDAFWLDTGNTAVGASKTATVEIVSSASLNNDDISLLLEYPGTASSSVASFASTLPAVTATATALPTSSATWTSPPATPVKQYLRNTFTPQTAGRVRGLIRLGKTSTTVWIDPRITIA